MKSFIERTAEEWHQDRKYQQACLAHVREKIKIKDFTRAFDVFRYPINADACQEFKTFFTKILLAMINKNHIAAFNKMATFQRGLAMKACQELLDEKGELSTDFLNLIQCVDLKNQIEVQSLVFGFMGAIHQQISADMSKVPNHQSLSELIARVPEGYAQLMDYAKKNNYQWINQELSRIKDKNLAQAIWQEFKAFSDKNPLMTTVMLGGMTGVIGVTLFGAYKLANASSAADPEELFSNLVEKTMSSKSTN